MEVAFNFLKRKGVQKDKKKSPGISRLAACMLAGWEQDVSRDAVSPLKGQTRIHAALRVRFRMLQTWEGPLITSLLSNLFPVFPESHIGAA